MEMHLKMLSPKIAANFVQWEMINSDVSPVWIIRHLGIHLDLHIVLKWIIFKPENASKYVVLSILIISSLGQSYQEVTPL